MSKRILFATGVVKRSLEVEVLGMPTLVPLSWSDGMIGAIPVFGTEEEAQAYAGKDISLYKISIAESDAED